MIDRREVQALVLHPNRADRLEVHLLTLRRREHLLALVGAAADVVTTADELLAHTDDEDRSWVAVGLTGEAVRLADVGERAFDALPSAFTRGMAHAAARLGDGAPGEDGAADSWDEPFGPEDGPVHVAVLVADDAPLGALAPFLAPEALAPGGPVQRIVTWRARWPSPDELPPLPDGSVSDAAAGGRRREHFGFADAVTDPVVEGSGRPATPGNGIWEADSGRWRAVATGEAVLGHTDEQGGRSGHPDAAHLERDGSYLVLRKLEQDVEGFQQACEAWAHELDGHTAASVGAAMVGRHQDGRVLGLEHEPWDHADYLYRDDRRDLAQVPPSAHIRRANPRDAIGEANALVRRHQLFRRGMPYDDRQEAPAVRGATTRPAARTRPPGRGLLFLAVCADLRRQFEFVQSQWMQDGNRFGLSGERDPLVGQRPERLGEQARKVSISVGGERRRQTLPTFVTTRGGEYLLVPSRSALRLLADARGD